MSQKDEYSPDEPLGAETYEQGDEATDEETRLDPDFVEEFEQDPSLRASLQADDLELDEAGAKFDDPETLATLDGGIDDPDGVGRPAAPALDPEEEGWDLTPGRTTSAVDGVSSRVVRSRHVFERVIKLYMGVAYKTANRRPGRTGSLGSAAECVLDLLEQFRTVVLPQRSDKCVNLTILEVK
jgi:hypothetical protein